jgi:Uncharacterized protein conserved in bacteria (DUF2059)
VNTSMRLAGAALALALFAPPAHAQSKAGLELAGRIYERAGLAAQVKSIPAEFEQGVAEYRGRVPDQVIAELAEAGRKSFAPPRMREEIVRALAQKLAAADMRQALDWLESDVGRRLVRAEEAAVGTMTQENLNAFLKGERGKPANPKREALLAELIKATRAVEVGASFVESISLGIAVGMDTVQPAEKRIGLPGLRERLRAAMPPQRLRADLGSALPAMYGYMYRGVAEADLAAYVEFNDSALGQRYNDAVTRALLDALAAAAVRVGQMLPGETEQEKV